MGTRVNALAKFFSGHLSTFVVVLVLGGVAYWGYRTEWRIPGFSSGQGSSSKEAGEAEHIVQGAAQVVPPKSPNKECPLDQTRIEFPSADAVRRAAIRSAPVEEKPVAATLRAPAEVDYDSTRVARLSAPVPGRIWRVEKEIGQRVRKGEVLVLVDAVRVGDAKAEFLQSLTQRDLKAATLENLRMAGEGVPKRRILEAEAEVRDARVRLFNAEQALINLGLPIRGKDVAKLSEEELAAKVRFLGLPESIVATLDRDTATSNLLPVTAPFAGVVAERQASPGEVVDAAKILFLVADLSRIWVVMNVRQEDKDRLAVGQAVSFEPDGHPGELVRGEVSWVSTTVDDKTRQLRARAVVDNPQEHLPARTFGTAQITVRETEKAVVVPTEAVQREGRCRIVFVRLTDQVFQARAVKLGVSSDGFVEILDGVRPGEVIASTGSFVLKSEVLKGRLGEHGD